MDPRLRGIAFVLFLATSISIDSSAHAQEDSSTLDSAPLNDINFGDRLLWAGFQIFAPENLDAIVPVYLYEPATLREQFPPGSQTAILPPCLLLTAQPDLTPGTICSYGRAESPDGNRYELQWGGTTGDEVQVPLDPYSASGDLPFALNHRIPGSSPDNTVWMAYDDWLNTVEQFQQTSSPTPD